MQNQYNNYLKRQTQQPINNFKEKIKNSLSGKTVNNTTMPNTANTPKVVGSTNKIGTGSVSGVSTPVQTPNNINAKAVTPNVSQAPLNASNTPSVVNNTIEAPIQTPVEANQPVNKVDGVVEGGAGLMSLSDVNNAIDSPKARSVETPNARSTTNYKDLLEQNRNDQIAQADKNWQIQEEAFKQQMDVLNGQYDQSKKDAENAYNESVDKLNENRYNQMEDLNVSGTNRGIQYSPQQLGLENVANINHNKNLAETSKQRNELLNKLQIEMNNSLAQLNMSMVNARNEYNKNILDINSNYANTLVGWGREDEVTQGNRDWEQKLLEEKRKWEEEQAKKDKEFQQMMQDMQNKFDKDQQTNQNNWQSGENKLDRDHDKEMAKKGRSGGGYSSRGYSGYSRSYNPYSSGYYNGYQNYDGGMPELSSSYLEDEIAQQAVDNNFKRLSTDAYNAIDSGGIDDLMERASFYDEFTSPMYDAYYGLNNVVDERLDNTRETALKHMFNKSYARSTNTAYNIGDTVYQPKVPLRQDYIDNVEKNKERIKSKFLDKYSKDEKLKRETRFKANGESIHEKVMDKNYKPKHASNEKKEKLSKQQEINKKFGAKESKYYEKSKSSKEKQKKAVTKTVKTVKNSAKNVKKSVSNSKKNAKTSSKNLKTKNNKAIKNSANNVKKSVSNSKKNVKKSTKKSASNFKKNVKKAINKIFKK